MKRRFKAELKRGKDDSEGIKIDSDNPLSVTDDNSIRDIDAELRDINDMRTISSELKRVLTVDNLETSIRRMQTILKQRVSIESKTTVRLEDGTEYILEFCEGTLLNDPLEVVPSPDLPIKYNKPLEFISGNYRNLFDLEEKIIEQNILFFNEDFRRVNKDMLNKFNSDFKRYFKKLHEGWAPGIYGHVVEKKEKMPFKKKREKSMYGTLTAYDFRKYFGIPKQEVEDWIRENGMSCSMHYLFRKKNEIRAANENYTTLGMTFSKTFSDEESIKIADIKY